MTAPGPDRRLMTARVLAVALGAGPVLLWAVGWVVVRSTGGGLAPGAGLTSRLAILLWGLAAVIGFGGSLLLLRRAEATAAAVGRASEERAVRRASERVQALLLVAWALLEGPAVLAGAFYLILGDSTLVAAAASVLALGLALTFPRRAWFPTAPVEPGGN